MNSVQSMHIDRFFRFVPGHWLDSLGNSILVSESRSEPPLELVVVLTPLCDRTDTQDKVIAIRLNAQGQWLCGSSFLEYVDDRRQRVVWVTEDGRRSVWSRSAESVSGRDPDKVAFPWLLNKSPQGPFRPSDTPRDILFDAARIAALLDIRQMIGSTPEAQERLTHILMDHDLHQGDGDYLIPGMDSPLWQTLPVTDDLRAAVARRLFRLQQEAFAVRIAWSDETDIRVGHHRISTRARDVQALEARWVGEPDDPAKSLEIARLLALYSVLDVPMSNKRNGVHLGLDPKMRQQCDYELFASPLNAAVPNGHFASKWYHIEWKFGSCGSYPNVLRELPMNASLCVNPPFTEAYLDDVMSRVDEMKMRFRLRISIPIQDMPWRKKLYSVFPNAELLQMYYDASVEQHFDVLHPTLLWEDPNLPAREPSGSVHDSTGEAHDLDHASMVYGANMMSDMHGGHHSLDHSTSSHDMSYAYNYSDEHQASMGGWGKMENHGQSHDGMGHDSGTGDHGAHHHHHQNAVYSRAMMAAVDMSSPSAQMPMSTGNAVAIQSGGRTTPAVGIILHPTAMTPGQQQQLQSSNSSSNNNNNASSGVQGYNYNYAADHGMSYNGNNNSSNIPASPKPASAMGGWGRDVNVPVMSPPTLAPSGHRVPCAVAKGGQANNTSARAAVDIPPSSSHMHTSAGSGSAFQSGGHPQSVGGNIAVQSAGHPTTVGNTIVLHGVGHQATTGNTIVQCGGRPPAVGFQSSGQGPTVGFLIHPTTVTTGPTGPTSPTGPIPMNNNGSSGGQSYNYNYNHADNQSMNYTNTPNSSNNPNFNSNNNYNSNYNNSNYSSSNIPASPHSAPAAPPSPMGGWGQDGGIAIAPPTYSPAVQRAPCGVAQTGQVYGQTSMPAVGVSSPSPHMPLSTGHAIAIQTGGHPHSVGGTVALQCGGHQPTVGGSIAMQSGGHQQSVGMPCGQSAVGFQSGGNPPTAVSFQSGGHAPTIGYLLHPTTITAGPSGPTGPTGPTAPAGHQQTSNNGSSGGQSYHYNYNNYTADQSMNYTNAPNSGSNNNYNNYNSSSNNNNSNANYNYNSNTNRNSNNIVTSPKPAAVTSPMQGWGRDVGVTVMSPPKLAPSGHRVPCAVAKGGAQSCDDEDDKVARSQDFAFRSKERERKEAAEEKKETKDDKSTKISGDLNISGPPTTVSPAPTPAADVPATTPAAAPPQASPNHGAAPSKAPSQAPTLKAEAEVSATTPTPPPQAAPTQSPKTQPSEHQQPAAPPKVDVAAPSIGSKPPPPSSAPTPQATAAAKATATALASSTNKASPPTAKPSGPTGPQSPRPPATTAKGSSLGKAPASLAPGGPAPKGGPGPATAMTTAAAVVAAGRSGAPPSKARPGVGAASSAAAAAAGAHKAAPTSAPAAGKAGSAAASKPAWGKAAAVAGPPAAGGAAPFSGAASTAPRPDPPSLADTSAWPSLADIRVSPKAGGKKKIGQKSG